jgi:hypothetical protein
MHRCCDNDVALLIDLLSKTFQTIMHHLKILKKGVTKLFHFPKCFFCGHHYHHQGKVTDRSKLETTLL